MFTITIAKTKNFFKDGCGARKTFVPFIEIFEEEIFDEDGVKMGTFQTFVIDFWVKWINDGDRAGGRHFQWKCPVGCFTKN